MKCVKLISALLLSAVLCTAADIICALADYPLGIGCCFAVAATVCFLLCIQRWLTAKALLKVSAVLVSAVLAVSAAVFALWYFCKDTASYKDTDTGKSLFYSGKNVLVIVPHEDDEINLLGGVTEQYIKYGSKIRFVFVTNGDFGGGGEVRLKEVVASLAVSGVPEEDIVFLGYGDEWQGGHIYHSASDERKISDAGFRAAYALENHPAYNDGAVYTLANLRRDIKDVILEFMPDTVFCNYFDLHADHRAVSLLFDSVMGEILKENPGYTPLVLKGYCYSTAFFAEDDYYSSENLLSTLKPSAGFYRQQTFIFPWENRIRLPVSASSVSRSLYASQLYKVLDAHTSQPMAVMAGRIINGDKVFWQRRTDSLCSRASVSSTSGDAAHLNDFLLLDSDDVTSSAPSLRKGIWVPSEDDAEKSALFSFPEKAAVSSVWLYDNPSEEDNILNAVISFEGGPSFETGPLHPGGSATVIDVSDVEASSFSVSVLEYEGENAGLSEVEAFSDSKSSIPPFVKLMNEAENFAYDYRIRGSSAEKFYLYAASCSDDFADYSVSSSSVDVSAVVSDNVLAVTCPAGKSAVISVVSPDGQISDSIVVSHPLFSDPVFFAEKFIHDNYSRLRTTAVYAAARYVYHLFSGTPIPVGLNYAA